MAVHQELEVNVLFLICVTVFPAVDSRSFYSHLKNIIESFERRSSSTKVVSVLFQRQDWYQFTFSQEKNGKSMKWLIYQNTFTNIFCVFILIQWSCVNIGISIVHLDVFLFHLIHLSIPQFPFLHTLTRITLLKWTFIKLWLSTLTLSSCCFDALRAPLRS